MNYNQLIKTFGNVSSVELSNESLNAIIEGTSRNYSYEIKVKSSTSINCECRFELCCGLKNIVIVVTEPNVDVEKLALVNMVRINIANMVNIESNEAIAQIETLLKFCKLSYKVTVDSAPGRDPLVKMLICYILVVLSVMMLGFIALLGVWLTN